MYYWKKEHVTKKCSIILSSKTIRTVTDPHHREEAPEDYAGWKAHSSEVAR